MGWLYENAPYGPSKLPVTYLDACALFGASQIVPQPVSLVFYCAGEPPFQFSAYFRPPTALLHLPLAVSRVGLLYGGAIDPLTGAFLMSRQGQPIAAATVLEYAVHTYGPASIASLLQAARDGENWRTAAPHVFGVSETEFEAGWRAWLAEEYGVDTTGFQAGRLAQDIVQQIDDRRALANYQAILR